MRVCARPATGLRYCSSYNSEWTTGDLGVSPWPCALTAGTKKTGPREGARLLKLCPVSYRMILRARSPPATNSTPAPSARAEAEAPPVGGSAAAVAVAVGVAVAVAVAVAVGVAVAVAVGVAVAIA